jgi:hypothetical protein
MNKVTQSIANFFGLNDRRRPRFYRHGNRSMSVELQGEVIHAAVNRRARRDDKRKVIHHQQTRLGLFKKK